MPANDPQYQKDYFAHWYEQNKASHKQVVKERKAMLTEEQRSLLWEYLQDKSCTDCSESDPLVLEFDHVRGEKRCSVPAMIGGYSWASILNEIAKCEIRCANCHRRRTATVGNHWRARRVK